MISVKDPLASGSQIQEISENADPNVQKPVESTAIRSCSKSKRCKSRNRGRLSPPFQTVAERKFIVAKKDSKKSSVTVTCKCNQRSTTNAKKCPCVAYENLRASQEDFFLQRSEEPENSINPNPKNAETGEGKLEKIENKENFDVLDESKNENKDGIRILNETSTPSNMKNQFLEEAVKKVPEPCSGRVKHLVKAFENLLSTPVSVDDSKEKEEKTKEVEKGLNWGFPGLGLLPEIDADVSATSAVSCTSSPSSFPSSELFKWKNLATNPVVRASIDSSDGSIGSRTSRGGGRRSRRNSSDSSGKSGGRTWKKQLKVTSQQPFKLRTEQRGRFKEEEFLKKVQELVIKEEKQRVPVAQGLPWTTDEPECLVKPPVKERTRPLDLKLHSDVRAVERAEFDNAIADKISWIEQYRTQREMEEKLAEEEEIKRLRKELVPRAQPMPYFDRPFMPKRSQKNPTVPKEPKFHIPHDKKIKCMSSFSDINIYQH